MKLKSERKSELSGMAQALVESPRVQTDCNQETNISSDRMHESRILKGDEKRGIRASATRQLLCTICGSCR